MAAKATLGEPFRNPTSLTPCDDVTPASVCLPEEPPDSRLRRGRRGWAELVGMSGGGTETPVACEAAQGGGGGKKRDSLGTPGAAHLIIKGTEWRAWSSVRGGGACWGPPLRVLPDSPAALSCLACLKPRGPSSHDPLQCSGRRAHEWRMGTSLSPTQSHRRVTSVLHPLVLCPLRLAHARKKGHLGKCPQTQRSVPYSVPV